MSITDEVNGRFKVDVTRGQRIGRVSSEWFSRPADQRFLDLNDLYQAVSSRAEHSRTRTIESRAVQVEARRDDHEALSVNIPGGDAQLSMTHWSFGQLCELVGAPSGYLRELPAPLAGINLQYGLSHHRAERMKDSRDQ